MQDILKNFGVDPLLLAAQVVNFLIIFWLLKKFAYKPIFAMLAKRQHLIEEGLENAKKSEEALQKALEEEKAIIKKAHLESQEVLADAQKQAQEIVQVAQEQAKDRVAKMLDDAALEIKEQTQNAEKELARHTTQLAVALLQKSLPSLVDTKMQKEVVSKLTKEIHA